MKSGLNNPGQPAEHICRLFFSTEEGGYQPAPKEYVINDVKETAKRVIEDSHRLKERFERFAKFLTETREREGRGPLNRSACIILFALGCEMIEREMKSFTVENVLEFISRHCGILIRQEYSQLAQEKRNK